MITLIIVDCQNDFISGTMSVKNAKLALECIKEFIKSNIKEIDKIIFTVDWHPYNHCSFKKYGGEYPSHCVQYTPGACIEPKLLKLVQSLELNYQVCPKGELEEVEQQGAFYEIEFCQDALGSRYYLNSIAVVDAESTFIVCGIAGDCCVKETISNLLDNKIVPKILLKGIVSTDNGNKLNKFIKENNLEIIE